MGKKTKEKMRLVLKKVAYALVAGSSAIGVASMIDESTGTSIASTIFEVLKVVLASLG